MRRLLVTLGLGVAGAIVGFVPTWFIAWEAYGSHNRPFEALSVSIIAALCGAIGLPLYWTYRRFRKSRPF